MRNFFSAFRHGLENLLSYQPIISGIFINGGAKKFPYLIIKKGVMVIRKIKDYFAQN